MDKIMILTSYLLLSSLLLHLFYHMKINGLGQRGTRNGVLL